MGSRRPPRTQKGRGVIRVIGDGIEDLTSGSKKLPSPNPFAEYDPRSPGFVPTNEPWADYYRQLYPGWVRPWNGWHQYKYATSATTHAEMLWAAREHGREWWESSEELGIFRVLTHPPVLLWRPEVFYPACLTCTWIGHSYDDVGWAKHSAHIHAITEGDEPAFVESFSTQVFDQQGRR